MLSAVWLLLYVIFFWRILEIRWSTDRERAGALLVFMGVAACALLVARVLLW